MPNRTDQPKRAWWSLRRAGLIATFGALLLLAIWLGSLLGLGRIDHALVDSLSVFNGRQASEDIVIIGIDDKSIAELGRWPWRRETHAHLIEQLIPAGIQAIGMDVIFSEPDVTRPQDDQRLAQAIASAGNVVLPVVMQVIPGRAPTPSMPVQSLASAARAIGHIHLELDADGIARSVFLREGIGTERWDSFALALHKIGGKSLTDEQLPGRHRGSTSTRHGGVVDAWQRDFWTLIPYTNSSTGYRYYSYVDVLQGRISVDELHGKYILVGATSAGLGDSYPTPLSGKALLTPGVEITAHMLDALIHRRHLEQAEVWQNALFSALPVIFAIWSFWRWGARWGLLAVSGIGVLVVLTTALAQTYGSLQLYPTAGLICLLLAYPLWSWWRLESVLAYLLREAKKLRAEHGDPGRFVRTRGSDDIGRSMKELRHGIGLLKALQRLVSDSLDSLPDAAFVVDRRGVILRDNLIARSLIGGSQFQSLVGEPLKTLLEKFLAPESLKRLLDLAWFESQTYTLELCSRSGVDYFLKCVPRLNQSGTLIGWIILLIDVQAVRAALRQRDEALRFISHDIRAPQTSILSLIELQRQGVDVGEIGQLLQRIESYSRRTLGIAEDFIHLAKAESGQYKLQEEDLEAVLGEVVDMVWTKAQARNICVEMTSVNEPTISHFDRSLMSRAIMNLLDNAIKFSPDGSIVRCGIDDAGEQWQFWVHDQGPGVPPDEQDFLFSKFWRSTDTRQSSVQGVGLGLAFVKRVVESHGGQVSMRNLASGGAEFRISLAKDNDYVNLEDI